MSIAAIAGLAKAELDSLNALAASRELELVPLVRALFRKGCRIVGGHITEIDLSMPEAERHLAAIDFSTLRRLEKLSITGSGLTRIELSGLGGLERLVLHGNSLRTLDCTPCPGLVSLSLGHNPIEQLDVSSLNALTDLSLLPASRLSDVHLPRSLKRLSLSSDELTRLDLEGLAELRYLKLSCKALGLLDLRDSSHLHWLDLKHMPQLTEVNLDGLAELTHLRMEHLSAMRRADFSWSSTLRDADVYKCGVRKIIVGPGQEDLDFLKKRKGVELADLSARKAVPLDDVIARIEADPEGAWVVAVEWLGLHGADEDLTASIARIRDAFETQGGTGLRVASLGRHADTPFRWLLQHASGEDEPRATLVDAVTMWDDKPTPLAKLLKSSRLPLLAKLEARCGLEDKHAKQLASRSWMESVERLSLGGNRIGPAGAAALAKLVSENDALDGLSLGYNPLGPEGALCLVSAGPGPRSADLNAIGLDGEAMVELAAGWSWNRLEQFWFQNPIGDVGLRALASIEALGTLESLSVSGAGTTAEGMGALLSAPFIANLSRLSIVDLDFEAPTFGAVADALLDCDALDGLERLDLSLHANAKISDEDRERLEDRHLDRLYAPA